MRPVIFFYIYFIKLPNKLVESYFYQRCKNHGIGFQNTNLFIRARFRNAKALSVYTLAYSIKNNKGTM